MPKMVNGRELRQMYETLGPQQCVAHLTEALEEGHLKAQDFSVRDLFTTLIEDGRELLDRISYRKSGGAVHLLEAGGAVDTSAFSNITGQIVYSRIKDAYQDPDFLWPDLCDTQTTQFLQGEKIPGIGRIADKAEVVGEQHPYPYVGLNEEYIETAVLKKRGFILPVTREIIIADRTGVLLRWCAEGGYWLGLNKEKRVLDVSLGITNNYKRNGTATNTYLTSGAYVNDQTGNALNASGNEWRALEKADLLFDAITDPNTGEPVSIQPDTMIVPSALKRSAARILSATEVTHVDNQANAVTVRTKSANPYGGVQIKILSSPQVKLRTSSASKWFYGQPKRAFCYFSAWDIETLQAPSNSEAEFMQDIMMRFKVSEMGNAQVLEPRFMTRNDT